MSDFTNATSSMHYSVKQAASSGAPYEAGSIYLNDRLDQLRQMMSWYPVSSSLNVTQTQGLANDSDLFALGTQEIAPDEQLLSFPTQLLTYTNSLTRQGEAEDFDQEVEAKKKQLRMLLQRFLSVAMIYGGYHDNSAGDPEAANEWLFGKGVASGDHQGWDVSRAPQGLHKMATGTNGYDHSAISPITTLTLSNMDDFLRGFFDVSQQRPSCLVMNEQMREKLVSVWKTEFTEAMPVVEDMNSPYYGCPLYRGIPVLCNNYIETYDNINTQLDYINSNEHPESLSGDTQTTDPISQVRRSSIYALILGKEQGLFGIFDRSQGEHPFKLEHFEERSTVDVQASLSFGLATATQRSVGRWGGIDPTT